MALDFPFSANQTDAKEPLDEQLMKVQIQGNVVGSPGRCLDSFVYGQRHAQAI